MGKSFDKSTNAFKAAIISDCVFLQTAANASAMACLFIDLTLLIAFGATIALQGKVIAD
jgi:hypothetical protein